jgi:hypothetical protein
MRFLTIYKAAETGQPPTQQHMDDMNRLIQEMISAGTLISTEGCLPTALGARVRRDGDTVTVTDGPFTEAKEVVGGFAIIEAASKEHAIELTRRFLAVAGDGESEIRQLYEVPAFDSANAGSAAAAQA